MRNLKKLLSVVLVVAMIASLCAVGSFSAAAAEYSEVTNYKEAAAVITGVGVMDGYEDGTMQYDKTVTREEAAAIICRALIGVDTANKLSTAVAPFADVAANRWSAPYINYLKAQGIVNGKSATKFDPTAEVTAVEFAKMMLCAVGYGKAGEFVGASWDVNTITAANNNGVYTGTLATDLTAPATREQCMLYTFNTMVRVPVVSYNSAFQSYYVGTSVVSGIDSRVAEDDIGDAAAINYVYTLAYRNFKLERTNAAGASDDYGRPAVKWASNGKTIAEEVCSKTPDYVLTGTVANSTIYNTLGSAVAKNINKQIWVNDAIDANADDVFEIYVDGNKLAVGDPGYLTTALAGDSFIMNAISGSGDTVEFYVDTWETSQNNSKKGDYKVTAVITHEYFGQVTAVSASQITVAVKSGAGFNINVKADDTKISGLAKKDYVLLNISKPNTTSQKCTKVIAAKAPVVGTFGGTNSMFQYIIDGVATSGSKVASNTLTGLISNSQYSFWYDSLGNVIFAELYKDGGSSDITRYAYVDGVRCNPDADYDFDFEVKLVYSDGTSEWVRYDVNGKTGAFKDVNGKTNYLRVSGSTYDVYDAATGGTIQYANIKAANGHFKNSFFTFTKSDNKVTLKAIDATFAMTAPNTTKTFNANTGVAFGSYTTNSSTKVAIVDGLGSLVTFTGESKFNGEGYTGDILYTFDKDSTKIKSIFIISNAALQSKAKAYYVGADHYDSDYGYVNLYIDGNYVEKAKVDLDDYKMLTDYTVGNYNFLGQKVFDVTVTGDVYDLEYFAAGAGEGIVNNASLATATNLTAYGYFELDKFSVTHYYAWATIDTVDNHAFWTAEADTGSKEAGNYDGATAPVNKFYFDSSTVIYDCVAGAGKVVSNIEPGQKFIAMTKNNATYGNDYCKYIWIVG